MTILLNYHIASEQKHNQQRFLPSDHQRRVRPRHGHHAVGDSARGAGTDRHSACRCSKGKKQRIQKEKRFKGWGNIDKILNKLISFK